LLPTGRTLKNRAKLERKGVDIDGFL
jgi:hypothetical protein